LKIKKKFFKQASQFDSIEIKYEEIKNEYIKSKKIIDDKEDQLEKMNFELFELKNECDKFKPIEKLNKIINELNQELLWSEIKENENEIKSREKNLENLKLSKKSYLVWIQDIENKLNANLSAQNDKNQKKEYLEKIQAFQKEIRIKIKTLKLQRESKSKELDKIRKKLEDQRNENQNDHEEERKQKEEKIKTIEKQIKEKEELERSIYQKNQTYATQVNTYENQIQEIKHEIESCERNIQNCNTSIDNLRKSSNDQIFRYGKQMANLFRDIEIYFQKGRFNLKPIGPIGMYIKSRNDEYSLAIEQCIGSFLSSFICANYQDEKVLQELAIKHFGYGKKPSIITKDFNDALYDHRRQRQDNKDYPTVYEMLDIQDKVVANTLIDYCSIDTVFLLPNYETAKKLVEFGTGRRRIQQAYTLNGDQFLNQQSFKTYACDKKYPKYIIKSTDNAIQENLDKIEQFKQSIPVIHQNVQVLNQELVKNKQSKDQNEKHLNQIRREINSLKNKLDDVENVFIQPRPVDLVVHEKELIRLKNEIENLLNQISVIDSQLNKNLHDEIKHELEITRSVNFIRNLEIALSKSDLNKLEEEKKDKLKIIENITISITKFETLIQSKKQENQESIHSALKFSERSTNARTRLEVQREIDGFRKLINEQDFEKNLLRQKDFLEKLKNYGKIDKLIEKNKSLLRKFDEILQNRDKNYEKLLDKNSTQCALQFSNILTNKNFKGKLLFNHLNKNLQIQVQNGLIDNSLRKKDLKSLSGGETSFCQIVLLLSFWRITESPVFVLDEFDVFMDLKTRKEAINNLVDLTKNTEQFIFITSQETK